jgi:hypothetical protein
MHKCTNAQIHKYTNTQIHKYTNLLSHSQEAADRHLLEKGRIRDTLGLLRIYSK